MLPLLFVLSCAPDPPVGELVFVRDAVLAPAAAIDGGVRVGLGRTLVTTPWLPGHTVTVGSLTAIAPRQPSCVPLFHVDLGDLSRHTATGGVPPDTAIAPSPDGGRFAVGTYLGEVLVADGFTGEVVARRKLPEALVKAVTWSADGQRVYAAEQSPDAMVHALDATSLAVRWSVRLADIVGSSPFPDGQDRLGVYELPAAYGLEALEGGDLLVVPLHSWNDREGTKRNRSQVLRLSSEGQVRSTWPTEPADAVLKHPRVDHEAGLVVVTVTRSAEGPAPSDLPIGGVQVLRLADLEPVMACQTPILEPYFTEAFIWQALDVSGDLGAVLTGYGDGRVRIVSLDGTELAALHTGAPVMAGEVPIHAAVGWGVFAGRGAVYSTQSTHIPWGAASPELRPPSAHPNENALFRIDPTGGLKWTWSAHYALQGLSVTADEGTLVVGAGARQTDDRRDAFGALVFDLGGPERGGAERLQAFCPTESAVFFEHVAMSDGRVAVTEYPDADQDGRVRGTYRLTVLR